ncbi:MAG TPA: ABC transporter permease [Steroidobacteraceae bacterium]|nr:ABC transporter permease [Steroidobacteraceae bacterium]HRX88947.1 ABC transporter permease [Steroidobacteraceae bacterium]
MQYAIKVALRYLTSNRLQSALLIGGVAIAVTVFTFNAALINGLAEFQIQRVVGSTAHVILEPERRLPAVADARDNAVRAVVSQRALERREQIKDWRAIETILDSLPGVTGISYNVIGTALATRGQQTVPVTLKGVEPQRLSAIAPIDTTIVDGLPRVGLNDILIGKRLADDLGIGVGQPLFVQSDQGRERVLTVRGLYVTGVESLDSRLAYVNLDTARVLFDYPDGLTEIEVKLADIYAAPVMAQQLADSTGLTVVAWTERNQRLKDALQGQRSSGDIIKFFTLITIVIGVASALLLTTYRRRPEIGIMRSFGVSQRFVLAVFMLQGALIGTLGSIAGCLLGYGFSAFIAGMPRGADGSAPLPVDPALGEYQVALLLSIAASVLAAILPARAASRVDPVEAIAQ